jgi:hypothetical protein
MMNACGPTPANWARRRPGLVDYQTRPGRGAGRKKLPVPCWPGLRKMRVSRFRRRIGVDAACHPGGRPIEYARHVGPDRNGDTPCITDARSWSGADHADIVVCRGGGSMSTHREDPLRDQFFGSSTSRFAGVSFILKPRHTARIRRRPPHPRTRSSQAPQHGWYAVPATPDDTTATQVATAGTTRSVEADRQREIFPIVCCSCSRYISAARGDDRRCRSRR